jgi:short-subunit dehydrogenase
MARHNLQGSTVVIMGASSGIGQATAEAFARRGVKLVLAARSEPALKAVAETCRTIGAEALVVPTDVTDAAAVKALAERALEFGGRIDVWVSNVGIGAVGNFHETPIEAHERVIRANLIGHFNDAHAVLPIFLRQDRGTFINMISVAGYVSVPYAASYSASKAGLKAFSEALRGELVNRPNIHVCDIYPTFVDTPAMSHAGNYVSRKLTAPPPVIDARRVAEAIVQAAESPRTTVLVGEGSQLIRLGGTVVPNLASRALAAVMRSYFGRADRVETSSGNLFSPSAGINGIDGGLRSPEQRAVATIAAGVVGGIAVIGLSAFLLRNRARPAVHHGKHRRRRR